MTMFIQRLLLSFLLILFIQISGSAQEFEWAIEPSFEGYDKVEIRNQILKLIVVKKDG